jgi:hypothetical protein
MTPCVVFRERDDLQDEHVEIQSRRNGGFALPAHEVCLSAALLIQL